MLKFIFAEYVDDIESLIVVDLGLIVFMIHYDQLHMKFIETIRFAGNLDLDILHIVNQINII